MLPIIYCQRNMLQSNLTSHALIRMSSFCIFALCK